MTFSIFVTEPLDKLFSRCILNIMLKSKFLSVYSYHFISSYQ
jgi:hypothetical protein